MKSNLFTTFLLLSLAQAILLVIGSPQSDLDYKSACKVHGSAGHLQLRAPSQSNDGAIPTKGILSATDTLRVQFYQCDLPFMKYKQRSSRNSHGSMGAPLEYFGHIRRNQDCLTFLQWNTSDHKQSSNLRYLPCTYANDERQVQQWFVYQVTAGGSIALAFVGERNSTQTPYSGPNYDWILSSSSKSRYLQVQGVKDGSWKYAYQVYLVSPIIEARRESYSLDWRVMFPM